ncbi:nucleotide exchange factor GrpE [Candidatus Peregrinibacteria bacterium]|nr:nucleotide exchange factor GrpE [Candidatus Peregrinibacteria bacterium]
MEPSPKDVKKSGKAGQSSNDAMVGSQGRSSTSNDARVAELEAKILELQQQVTKLAELAGRAQADLQNAKQRMGKDADDLRKYAAEAFLKKLLPVVDHFQRAFQQLPVDLQNHESASSEILEWARPEIVEWVKGITAIEQDFLRQLTESGLRKMDVLGQQVDTARHEVITVGPGKEGEILEVFEDGYELHGKFLRPAKVKVGDGSSAETVPPSPQNS